MTEQPTIIIQLERIEHFLQEAVEHSITRVYRSVMSRGEAVSYSAWDPERKTLISGNLTLPAIVELNAAHPGERYSRGFSFDTTGDFIIATTDSKFKLVQALKKLNVAKDVVAEFRSVKVEQINKMIDDSITEETGDKIFTTQESCGFIEKVLECNTAGGLVKTLTVRISRDHRNFSYVIRIDNWSTAFETMLHQYEEPFRKAKVDVVPGSVSTK